jgi:predicted DNA-binding transcriptional regulator YafY
VRVFRLDRIVSAAVSDERCPDPGGQIAALAAVIVG